MELNFHWPIFLYDLHTDNLIFNFTVQDSEMRRQKLRKYKGNVSQVSLVHIPSRVAKMCPELYIAKHINTQNDIVLKRKVGFKMSTATSYFFHLIQ
jgi:hypothetical protein